MGRPMAGKHGIVRRPAKRQGDLRKLREYRKFKYAAARTNTRSVCHPRQWIKAKSSAKRARRNHQSRQADHKDILASALREQDAPPEDWRLLALRYGKGRARQIRIVEARRGLRGCPEAFPKIGVKPGGHRYSDDECSKYVQEQAKRRLDRYMSPSTAGASDSSESSSETSDSSGEISKSSSATSNADEEKSGARRPRVAAEHDAIDCADLEELSMEDWLPTPARQHKAPTSSLRIQIARGKISKLMQLGTTIKQEAGLCS